MSTERRIIAFTLFGAEPRYWQGAVRNAETAPQFYPGWRCRFYYDLHSSYLHAQKILQKLSSLGADLIGYKAIWPGEQMFWRALPLADVRVDRMLCRDVDSRFSKRESAAVEEWIKSRRAFHVMRDHPAHDTAIPGGMWGARRGTVPGIYELIGFWQRLVLGSNPTPESFYGMDQRFYREMIWPLVQEHCVQHDEFTREKWKARPWPVPVGEDGHFVGEVYDEYDQPRLRDRASRLL
jgi:hypothetical protein